MCIRTKKASINKTKKALKAPFFLTKITQARLVRALVRRCQGSGNLLEHFKAHFASCDFAQGCDGRLVACFDFGCVALAQHACAVGGRQNELKTVRDLLKAVFDGNASHLGVISGNSDDVEGLERVSACTLLGTEFQALRVNNGFEVEKRAFKYLVNYNEVKMTGLSQLFTCIV